MMIKLNEKMFSIINLLIKDKVYTRLLYVLIEKKYPKQMPDTLLTKTKMFPESGRRK